MIALHWAGLESHDHPLGIISAPRSSSRRALGKVAPLLGTVAPERCRTFWMNTARSLTAPTARRVPQLGTMHNWIVTRRGHNVHIYCSFVTGIKTLLTGAIEFLAPQASVHRRRSPLTFVRGSLFY